MRPDQGRRARGAGARRVPDGLGGRRERLAEDPRRDGQGHAGRANLRGGAAICDAAGIKVGFFLQFGYPGETRAGYRRDAADGARLPPGRHRHVRVVSAARHAVPQARPGPAWGEAQLGEQSGPRHDVPGGVCARVLPYALRCGAPRVPHAQRAGSAGGGCAPAGNAAAGPRPRAGVHSAPLGRPAAQAAEAGPIGARAPPGKRLHSRLAGAITERGAPAQETRHPGGRGGVTR